DDDARRVHAAPCEVREHELQLVHVPNLEYQILGPHVGLVVREEILEPKVLGDPRVLILRRDLDEPFGIRIAIRRRLAGTARAALRGPVADVVQALAAVFLGAEWEERDEIEVRERLERFVESAG